MLNIYLKNKIDGKENKVQIGVVDLPFDEYHKAFPLLNDYLLNTLGIPKVFYYRVHAIPYEYKAIIDFGEHDRFIYIEEVDEELREEEKNEAIN